MKHFPLSWSQKSLGLGEESLFNSEGEQKGFPIQRGASSRVEGEDPLVVGSSSDFKDSSLHGDTNQQDSAGNMMQDEGKELIAFLINTKICFRSESMEKSDGIFYHRKKSILYLVFYPDK